MNLRTFSVSPRDALLESLVATGLDGFTERHKKELIPLPHSAPDCALPNFIGHSDNGLITGRLPYPGKIPMTEMPCGVSHYYLASLVGMGSQNPFFIYSAIDNLMRTGSHSHVQIAILPSTSYRDIGDIITHVQPYGPRAVEIAQHLDKRLSTGRRAFPHGSCLGFFPAAVGFDKRGNPYLYVEMQTDGNRLNIVQNGKPRVEPSLPEDLRRMYMEGQNGVNSWYAEGLDCIEDACSRAGIPILIPTWNDINLVAQFSSVAKSASARQLYESPEARGYEKANLVLSFPQRAIDPFWISERRVEGWLKKS